MRRVAIIAGVLLLFLPAAALVALLAIGKAAQLTVYWVRDEWNN